jgi:hypothetical protein
MNQRFVGAGMLLLALFAAGRVARAEEQKVPLKFSGGHETDPEDRGRPVVLVAAGLGVKPEVFREAFRGVTPARGGPPTGEQARKNKEALMKVLKPHGVTNDRLDEVSNYYRYRREAGEMWPTTEATGYALVENGQVKKIIVTEPGAGYSSPPNVTIPGHHQVRLKAAVQYEKELTRNGGVSSVKVSPSKPSERRG